MKCLFLPRFFVRQHFHSHLDTSGDTPGIHAQNDSVLNNSRYSNKFSLLKCTWQLKPDTTKHQSTGLPSSDRREHLENNGHTLHPDSCTWTPCERSAGSEELSPGIYHIPQAYIHIFHSETIIDFKKSCHSSYINL